MNNKGFSLLEVVMALALFATFISSFYVSQGIDIDSSASIREDLRLHNLAEMVINDLKVNPPKFETSLTVAPVEKNFEGEFENYKYIITFERMEIPDLNLIQGSEEEEGSGNEENSSNAMNKKVFEQIKKYVHERIWQARVEVVNKETEYSYSLSTWLDNTKAKAKVSF